MTNKSHLPICTDNPLGTLTQAQLHQIVRVDPNTTKLVPISPQPQVGITAAKFGKHHLLIGTTKVSMAKLAYLYHHGTMPSMVTHLDHNKENYAPTNLVPYIPQGRGKPRDLTQPTPSTITDEYGNYIPVLRPPLNPKYPPQVKFIIITDVLGYALGNYTSQQYATNLAAQNISNIRTADAIRLGVLPPDTPL